MGRVDQNAKAPRGAGREGGRGDLEAELQQSLSALGEWVHGGLEDVARDAVTVAIGGDGGAEMSLPRDGRVAIPARRFRIPDADRNYDKLNIDAERLWRDLRCHLPSDGLSSSEQEALSREARSVLGSLDPEVLERGAYLAADGMYDSHTRDDVMDPYDAALLGWVMIEILRRRTITSPAA
jgi:hypothetical protein